jgi:Domain of unknown function (DUF4279)
MSVHRYTVEFVIYGPVVDLDAVSAQLGLSPSRVMSFARRATGIRETAWVFDGSAGGMRPAEWSSLEAGISFVLDLLWPNRLALGQIGAQAKTMWRCGHFKDGFDGGPRLSAEMLRKLGEIGAELSIDCYGSDGAGAAPSALELPPV